MRVDDLPLACSRMHRFLCMIDELSTRAAIKRLEEARVYLGLRIRGDRKVGTVSPSTQPHSKHS